MAHNSLPGCCFFQIYALNKVMTELEQQQFEGFCKQMQSQSESWDLFCLLLWSGPGPGALHQHSTCTRHKSTANTHLWSTIQSLQFQPQCTRECCFNELMAVFLERIYISGVIWLLSASGWVCVWQRWGCLSVHLKLFEDFGLETKYNCSQNSAQWMSLVCLIETLFEIVHHWTTDSVKIPMNHWPLVFW